MPLVVIITSADVEMHSSHNIMVLKGTQGSGWELKLVKWNRELSEEGHFASGETLAARLSLQRKKYWSVQVVTSERAWTALAFTEEIQLCNSKSTTS